MGITIQNSLNAIQNFLASNDSASIFNKYIYVTKDGTFKTQGPLGNIFTSKETKNNTINALKTLFADKQQEGLSKGNPFNCEYNDIFTANHGVNHTKLDQAFNKLSKFFIMKDFNDSIKNLKEGNYYTPQNCNNEIKNMDRLNSCINSVASVFEDKIKDMIKPSIENGSITASNIKDHMSAISDIIAEITLKSVMHMEQRTVLLDSDILEASKNLCEELKTKQNNGDVIKNLQTKINYAKDFNSWLSDTDKGRHQDIADNIKDVFDEYKTYTPFVQPMHEYEEDSSFEGEDFNFEGGESILKGDEEILKGDE